MVSKLINIYHLTGSPNKPKVTAKTICSPILSQQTYKLHLLKKGTKYFVPEGCEWRFVNLQYNTYIFVKVQYIIQSTKCQTDKCLQLQCYL